jgi:hypothetical protein
MANQLLCAEDDGVTVVLDHRGHETRQVVLRRTGASRADFEGIVEMLPVGEYHAWMAVPTLDSQGPETEGEEAPATDFKVTAPPGEFQRVQMDRAALEEAAELTEGRFYTFETAGKLLDDLPPGRQVPIESLPPRPLWNRWPLLVLFLVLLTTEWVMRKTAGMV